MHTTCKLSVDLLLPWCRSNACLRERMPWIELPLRNITWITLRIAKQNVYMLTYLHQNKGVYVCGSGGGGGSLSWFFFFRDVDSKTVKIGNKFGGSYYPPLIWVKCRTCFQLYIKKKNIKINKMTKQIYKNVVEYKENLTPLGRFLLIIIVLHKIANPFLLLMSKMIKKNIFGLYHRCKFRK